MIAITGIIQNRARMIHNRQGSVKTRKLDGEKGPTARYLYSAPTPQTMAQRNSTSRSKSNCPKDN